MGVQHYYQAQKMTTKITALHHHQEHDTVLCAAEFTHTNGTTMVRIIPAELVEAEARALESVGFSLVNAHDVGRCLARAAGFPTWPMSQDPANAHHAVNLVGDLEWAKRNVSRHGKQVITHFDELTASLTRSVPHFVPTLWEELARIFLGVGKKAYAKRCFHNARDVERMYAIDVDITQHVAVFTEFAVLGVVGARELSIEAAAVSHHMTPQEAFDYFLHLCGACAKFRRGCHSAMANDLRKLAQAAGLSDFESDRALIETIMESPGFMSAPAGFYRSIHASLVTIATQSQQCRQVLLTGKPPKLGIDEYLTLLEDSGALAELATNSTDYARWLIEFITTECGRLYQWGLPYSQKLIDVVTSASAGLAGMTLPLDCRCMSIDLIDALSAGGVVWELPDAEFPRWHEWFHSETPRRDLAGIAHHNQLADWASATIPLDCITKHYDLVSTMPALRGLCRKRLEQCAVERDQLTGYQPEWDRFIHYTAGQLLDPRFSELHPEAIEKIFAFDPVVELQARLCTGMVEEFAWPAVEQAIDRLQAEALTDAKVEFRETYPAVAIRVGETVEIIDGDQVVACGTIPLEARVRAAYLVCDEHEGNKVAMLYELGRWDPQCYCTFWEPHAGWLGETPVLDEELYDRRIAAESYSLPIPAGRLTGYGELTYPEQPENFGGRVLGTGPHYLITYNYKAEEWETGIDRDDDYFDPIGRGENIPGVDLTGLPTSPSPVGQEFSLWHSTVIPAQPQTRDSLCGTLNGQHVRIVFRGPYLPGRQPSHIWTPLGSFSSQYGIMGAIRRPGGGVWLIEDRPYRGRYFYDSDTDRQAFGSTRHSAEGQASYIYDLPLSAFHQLRPRDEDMSVRLRNVSYEQAAMLLASPTAEVVKQEIGADSVLGVAILQVIAEVQELSRWLATARNPVQNNPPAPRQVSDAASKVLWQAKPGHRVNKQKRRIGPWDGGPLPWLFAHPGEIPSHKEWVSHAWYELIGREKVIVAAISTPSNDPGAVIELCEWLLDMAASGVFASGWHYHQLDDEPESETLEWRQGTLVYRTRYDLHALTRLKDTSTEQPDLSMDKQEFVDSVAAIKAWAEQRTKRPGDKKTLFGGGSLADAATRLSDGTILLPETATYLLHGLKNYFVWEWPRTVLGKAGRAELGFTRVTERAVLTQVWGFDDLEWLLASGVDDSFPARGLNIDTMRDYLLKHYGKPLVALTAGQMKDLKRLENNDQMIIHAISPRLGLPQIYESERAGHYLEALLYLAQELDLSDPNRARIATKLRDLREFAVQQSSTWDRLGTMPLGCDYHNDAFTPKYNHSSQTIRVLLEGLLDGFVEGLGVVGGVGVGFDPCVSVPGLVVEVSEVLGVSLDCARYFLQVLALVCPSDVCVRRWNGWGSGDIRGVGEVLVGRGLLVGGRRSGAGRSWFLPGGWLSGVGGLCGVEVWKVSLFLVWGDVVFRPVVGGCPVLCSVGELFTTAWERYKNGDKPGFEDATTVKYRQR
ncbi:hypothetical protein [Corynebacterium matruchotii]